MAAPAASSADVPAEPPVVLITGSSRGIGRLLATKWSSRP